MKKKNFPAKLSFYSELKLNKPPTIAKDIFDLGSTPISAKPRAFRIKDLHTKNIPQNLLKNRDNGVIIKALVLNWGRKSERMINSDGDEIWYVYKGAGICLTSFGMLWFGAGDYIYIPQSSLYRIETLSPGLNLMIGIESEKPFRRPDFGGLINRDIPYSPEKIVKPESFPGEPFDSPDRPSADGSEWDVYIKRLGVYGTKARYDCSPFLADSWAGEIYPFVLHTSDINTLVSPTTHIDPTAFATFISEDKSVAVSTFKPRWIHSLPYSHMNYYDEFLFYAAGYEARWKTVGEGDATFHPQGIWHGPQLEALVKERERGDIDPKNSEWVDELAIMFESRKPLIIQDPLFQRGIEIENYWKSWHEGWKKHKEELRCTL